MLHKYYEGLKTGHSNQSRIDLGYKFSKIFESLLTRIFYPGSGIDIGLWGSSEPKSGSWDNFHRFPGHFQQEKLWTGRQEPAACPPGP